jgi:hypothetical protein
MRQSSRAQADVDFGKGKGFNTCTPLTGYGTMVKRRGSEKVKKQSLTEYYVRGKRQADFYSFL